MDNENNEEPNDNNNNSSLDNLYKFIVTVFINIFIVTCFLSYLLKEGKISNHLLNNNYKSLKTNKNINLRHLDDNTHFSQIEKQLLLNTKKKSDAEEIKRYITLLLENLGIGLDSIRNIIIGKPYITTKDLILEKQKEIFLSRLMNYTYMGNWENFPYETKIKNISKFTNNYYLNSSKNNFQIGSYTNGSVYFDFNKLIEMKTKKEVLAMNMKNLGGDYIDNWIHHISYAKISELGIAINTEKNTYNVKGLFSTSMIKGQLFNKRKYNNKKIQCATLAEIEFPLVFETTKITLTNGTILIKNISTIDPSNFTMILSSTCGFRIKIKAKIYDKIKDYFENKIKVNYFSLYCIISSFLYCIGATCLTYSLNKNENAISVISLECFCQNIAWHSYCGITNINFGLYYYNYFGNFCILALFPLLNFMVADLRFLYFYWKIKKRVSSDRNFIKLRLKFFAMFYFLLLFSFFSISSFYIDYIYITILSIALWTPQIIHNIIYNNKYIYPTFYIIVTTIDRMIYSFYFRGYKYNYIQLKDNLFLIIILSCYILFSIAALYLQTFLGPRFMLSAKYQKKAVDFHKTKEELLKIKPESIKEECVICLSPLFDNEDDNIKINNKDMNVDITINNKDDQENKPEACPAGTQKGNIDASSNSQIALFNDKTKDGFIINNIETKRNLKEGLNLCNNDNKNKYNKDSLAISINEQIKQINVSQHNKNRFSIKKIGKIINIILFKSMFNFYKLKPNLGDKKYMLITCGHVFHSSCVEKWFERKKECPNCRAHIEDYL